MKKLLLAAALCAAPFCPGASIIGTSVTGSLQFNGGGANFYDPANSFVPATGYQNSPDSQNSATLNIVGGNEFGFNDSANLDVTSFSASGFTFSDTEFGGGGNAALTLTFTDAAFNSVSLISSNFTGITVGIVGDVITVNIPEQTLAQGATVTASFSVGSDAGGAVPEPSTFALLAIGAAGLAGFRKLRART
jgi:hypothetical protein